MSDTRSDLGNAERFVGAHGNVVRYCPPASRWLVWDTNRWRWDDTDLVVTLAQDTVRGMLHEALAIEDNLKRQAHATHALRSHARGRIDAMLSLAGPLVAVRPDELDARPQLLNVANGTLDLATNALAPHDPDALITKLAPAVYDARAKCPNWTAFLNDITSGNRDMAGYLQRAVGYSLTGETLEHVLFMLYGSGCNGKTTFIEALRNVFGDYARAADFATFIQHRSPSAPRNDLAMLRGARFVTAAESDDGGKLDESFVKQVTGGDKVTARFLYSEHFEFRPEFKLWLSTNHKPTIHGTDDGIWRRIRLLPFTVRIPDSKIDRHLPEKLKAESSGILRWALDGLADYRERGLDEPAIVLNATKAYRADEDLIGRFLAACCSVGTSTQIQARALYNAYLRWAGTNGEPVLDERKFSRAMSERGIQGGRMTAGRFWTGISLNVGCRVM